MARERREVLRAAGVTGCVALAGCVSGFDEAGRDPDVNVGVVYASGGLGDNSFNDMAQQGAMRAEEEFDVLFDQAEPESEGEFDGTQRNFAESGRYDLICCIGYAQEGALAENAAAYTDQEFIIVDSVVEAPNVRSYVFDEPGGSFQAGHLAGLLTQTEFSAGDGSTNPDESVVGFVGGTETPLIESFHAGFAAGVEYVDPDIELLSSYVGEFNDTAAGQETARLMYDRGADVVFHAAGRTGIGVFQAAQSEGRFAIGVDDDQSVSEDDYADVIVASMVKQVDRAVFTAIESAVEGTFEGGEVEELGLEDDGVDVVYGQSLGDEIPEEIRAELADSREKLIDGEIDVPGEL
ncbi:BMP family lipoprotein [Natronococcus occultus]|uniref:Putative ABC-type transport system, periplasmic component/surface lipoprotein n=1 Tax=Natronococcus occultus SP4 TaxID=694430 RepID=L0JWP5_9EURY|nr:BMP family protein [Natronococcus occultus]AGB37191.1 putative ABC-type transport system, periplasmic component/surface lipoprotein [Natronococcus occultus SP4]